MPEHSRTISRAIFVMLSLHTATTTARRFVGAEADAAVPKWRRRMDRPMLAALFLPPFHLKSTQVCLSLQSLRDQAKGNDTNVNRISESSLEEWHLANIESVEPILDIAIGDAQDRYLNEWFGKPWMKLLTVAINECEDQKRVAWAALEAVKWTNGSGLDVAFGPACDYVLATANRILSFSKVPMFTSAGFSEWFKDKANNAELMTRQTFLVSVLPNGRSKSTLQDHIALMIEQLSERFGWVRPTLFYQKAFWESELLESGFCKMMMTGLFVRSANKQSNLAPNPRILPNYEGSGNIREVYMQNLIDNVGVERAGESLFTCMSSMRIGVVQVKMSDENFE
ncbi:unnamed protein product [Toxocara canis]|uniref:ANF_receptor domain-containing protein n=1 Tax=Toxocara canis TaxID=6265 RepID=A0A183UNL5_TOXCA|nr:unnamed protein product [Toxocara canis]